MSDGNDQHPSSGDERPESPPWGLSGSESLGSRSAGGSEQRPENQGPAPEPHGSEWAPSRSNREGGSSEHGAGGPPPWWSQQGQNPQGQTPQGQQRYYPQQGQNPQGYQPQDRPSGWSGASSAYAPYGAQSSGYGQAGPFAGGPQQSGSYPANNAAPTRKRGRGGLVAGAVVLALVAGGVGGGVATLLDQGSSTSTTTLNSASATQPVSRPTDGSVQQVATKVLPSVVQIQVIVGQSGGEGSGIVLSNDGYILTNNHVVAEAAKAAPGAITVAFNDGSTATASIVGRDPSADIAVIKVAGKSDLKPISIGTSGNLAVGQPVVAVGSPLGLAGTVTSGIVSALDRPVRASGEAAAGDQSSVLDAIQTDAAINPGNSGGALVNMDGTLVGINSAIASLGQAPAGQQSGSIGLGFAIPIDQANRIAQELIKTGTATQSVLGISVTDSRSGSRGATIGDIAAGSAAATAGLKNGMVITKIDKRVIEDSDSLVAAVRSYAPGTKVALTVAAPGGAGSTVNVTLGSKNVGVK